jgi:T5orf172 domain
LRRWPDTAPKPLNNRPPKDRPPMADMTDDELLAELGVSVERKPTRTFTPREERIIAGFEDILRFHEEHGRAPRHGEQHDIFERLYAVRLDRLRALDDCRALLAGFDTLGLLSAVADETAAPDQLDDDALLAELGISEPADDDITQLRHVQSREERRAAEEIANRERCVDFGKFQPLFADLQLELDSGIRTTRPFVRDAGFLKSDIVKGQFFILGGQLAYVAEVGDALKAPNGEFDARLRVIYSNGTESNLLRRSLQRALYKDEAGRRVTESAAGPLFAGESDDDDQASGTIYVLRSKSDHPLVTANREIGVTGGDVPRRIANAKIDPTYLMADVEIVATYELFNINRTKLENLIHRIFEPARLDIEIKDRFGRPVTPREWYLVPHFVINEAVDRIRDGSIADYVYDPQSARLERQNVGDVE